MLMLFTNFNVQGTMRLPKNLEFKSNRTIDRANVFVQLNFSCKIKFFRDSDIFADNLIAK